MKKTLLTQLLIIFVFYINAQNVGIGTNVPKSKLDVNGNTSIGATYSGTNAAPTNGAIIEGVVGIGTPSPDASAQLDVTSTTKGFLPPRVTFTQMNAIATPAEGLIVFETDCKNLYVYKDSRWCLVQTSTTPITTTFNYNAASPTTLQQFTVPPCVNNVEVQVWGAGGGGSGIASPYDKGSAGGGGAYVNANIKVTPGDILYISVGQAGSITTTPLTTSYGGGGSTRGVKAAYGGGCSAILSANALNQGNSLVVAGGGGGAGYNRTFGNILGGGGSSINASGVATAVDGIVNGTDPGICSTILNGKGGTTSAGGAGGTCGFGVSGTGGTAFQGGIGNVSGTCTYLGATNYTTEGGGGGGGYYGGGGGGARVAGNCDFAAGGGGGGSSYINTSIVSLIESAAGDYGSTLSAGPGGNSGGSGRKNYSGHIGNGGDGYYGPFSQTGGNGRVVIIYQ